MRDVQKSQELLQRMEFYFFDLDGCIYYTDQPASGSKNLLELLRKEGKRLGFITNNSRNSAAEIAVKLQNMGLNIPPDEILTVTEMTGSYLMGQFGSLTVAVAGSKNLQESINQWGHKVCDLFTTVHVDMVVLGRDTEFSFEKLQRIATLVENEAQIISTNPDLFHPGSEHKRVPETGSLVAAVEAVIGRSIETVGKPNPFLYSAGMKLYEAQSEKCIMVGDNLHTDILGAKRAGMRSIWISGSGTNDAADLEKSTTANPDIIVQNMEELLLTMYKRSIK